MSKIVPVIHIIDWPQVKYNVDMCYRNGVDFIFLIKHGGKAPIDKLIECFYNTKELYPDLKVGVNFLQATTLESFKIANSMKITPDAIWSDVSHVNLDDLSIAEEIKKENYKNIQYFGSIAFKYQRQPSPDELKKLCKIAPNYMDVVTTSGPATGVAANITKIQNMKEWVGDAPMAIASGVNYGNKSVYSQYIDYLLVASSITDSATEFIIEPKLKELL